MTSTRSNVHDEGVHYGHPFVADSSVGMDLLQHCGMSTGQTLAANELQRSTDPYDIFHLSLDMGVFS